MRQLGRSLRELHPTVLKQPPGAAAAGDGAGGVAFEVFSSNFARTQQSAQGLLHGLGAHELLGAEGAVPVVVREVRRAVWIIVCVFVWLILRPSPPISSSS